MSANRNNSQFRACWKAGVPLVSIDSADPAATIRNCIRALNGKGNTTPLLEWDCVAGMRATNIDGQPLTLGQKAVMAIAEGTPGPEMITNPVEALSLIARRSSDEPVKEAIIFLHGMHRMIKEGPIAQALWNCRDACKPSHVTLVCLGPTVELPAELGQDVMGLSEPLPDETELGEILDSTLKDADLPLDIVKPDERPKVIDTLRGLSAFAAEQVLATSLVKTGVDHDALWTRKVRMIEQTPGLSVWRGQEKFSDLGGLDNLKGFLQSVLTSGRTPVRALGFIDEIEKGLAGSAGDTSGTSQDQLQVFLKVMQDLNIPGLILVGHPGTGKSAIAKAAGSIADAPLIAIDTGAMKGSLVGESESRIRAAMEVFKAVSQGKGLFIATCNKIASLPPELRRRFTLGTFFVDLPTPAERAKIWPLWIKRFDLTPEQTATLPDCDQWSGAEIRACCDVAYRTGYTLAEAAQFVVPVIKSAPEQVETLRKLAHNRFISASNPGTFNYTGNTEPKTANTGRKIEV